ncbi:hypothetical protein DAPK24_003740 [Pichia kluyveri]|uniref:Uncharacterized protein n=1 Tax=Pichia kluyveri TaxID=36015 RepID=A0AAV5QX91_PICKL|nr:hypothetical protein DAPK24_003740 [Pichia kluyveri]
MFSLGRRHTHNLLFILIAAILLLFLAVNILPSQTNYYASLDPSLQHQKFGIVSEDGTIEAGQIQKVSESEDYKRISGANRVKQKSDNKNNNNNKNNVIQNGNMALLKAQKVKGAKANNAKILKQAKNRINDKNNIPKVDNNLVQFDNNNNLKIDNYRNKMRESTKHLLSDSNVQHFIDIGEPMSELSEMSGRVRKLFLRKVANKKKELGLESNLLQNSNLNNNNDN